MIYDISVNLDVAGGLTNGATCVMKHIEYKSSMFRPAIIWVLFKDAKLKYQEDINTMNTSKSWIPIFEVKRTTKLMTESNFLFRHLLVKQSIKLKEQHFQVQ